MYDMTGPFTAGLQAAQNLRSAANQQAQLAEQTRAAQAQEAMRQQQLDQDKSAQTANQAHQSLADQLSVIAGGGQQVTNGNVQQPVAPQASNDGSPMSTVAQAAMPSSVGVPAAPGRTVSAGGQQYQMPSADEAATDELHKRVALASALHEATSMPISDDMAGVLNMAPGTKLPSDVYPAAFEAYQKRIAPQPAMQPKSEVELATIAAGDDPVAAKRAQSALHILKSQRADAASGADAPPKMTAAAIRSITDARDKGFKQAHDSLMSDVGNVAVARPDAMKKYQSAMQMTQNKYQDDIQSYGRPVQPVTFDEHGNASTASPANAPAAAATPPAAQKTATQDQLQRYAAQRKIPMAQATQEFQKAGYNTAVPPPTAGN